MFSVTFVCLSISSIYFSRRFFFIVVHSIILDHRRSLAAVPLIHFTKICTQFLPLALITSEWAQNVILYEMPKNSLDHTFY